MQHAAQLIPRPIRLRRHAAEDDLLPVIVADLSKHHLERASLITSAVDGARDCLCFGRWRGFGSPPPAAPGERPPDQPFRPGLYHPPRFETVSLIALEREGFIRRQPGVARSIELLIDPDTLPRLLPSPGQPVTTSAQRHSMETRTPDRAKFDLDSESPYQRGSVLRCLRQRSLSYR
jgi:hypothetical protein